jgi:hypothetical protein
MVWFDFVAGARMPSRIRPTLTIDAAIEEEILAFDDATYVEFLNLFADIEGEIARRLKETVTLDPVAAASARLELTAEFDPTLRRYVLVAAELLDGPPSPTSGLRARRRRIASTRLSLIADAGERAIVWPPAPGRRRRPDLNFFALNMTNAQLDLRERGAATPMEFTLNFFEQTALSEFYLEPSAASLRPVVATRAPAHGHDARGPEWSCDGAQS